jgi:hypothetical protein
LTGVPRRVHADAGAMAAFAGTAPGELLVRA